MQFKRKWEQFQRDLKTIKQSENCSHRSSLLDLDCPKTIISILARAEIKQVIYHCS